MRFSRLSLTVILIGLLLIPGVAAPVAQAEPAAQSVQATDDWPTFMHDVARTGATTQTLAPTDRLYQQWKFSFGERVEVEVQPIVANGRVYVGVMNGKMYCLNAATGAQQWVYQAGGAIPHTATVADGRLFFGSLDGQVYALDAATGAALWKYRTGGPVYSAPAVVDGTVYIGSVDGALYALHAATGNLAWKYQTGGRVTASPAVANGRVYFGSEDMNAYCVNTSGQEVWRHALSGAGMANTYPVVSAANNVVIFVTIKPGRPSYVHSEDYPNASAGANIVDTWRAYYQQYPDRRHLFYLDTATGADKWDGTSNSYQPMPLPNWGLTVPVLDSQGRAWFPSPSGVTGYLESLSHDNRLMRIDLSTGVTTQVAATSTFQLRTDEAGRHTLIDGKYFYTISEDVGVYNPTTGSKQALYGNGTAPYNFGTHMDPLDPMPTKHLWRYGGAITMGGVPGASPLVAAGGRAYYVSYGWLYCLATTAGSPAAVSVKSDPASATNPMPPTLDEIRDELNSQVSQIVAAGHLGPTARFVQPQNVLLRGASTPFLTFWHDGELVRAVAEALPYLNTTTQASARAYLRTEVSNYLLDDSDYEYRQDSLSYAGITTTWWADNEYLVAERLYALYAYAHYTDDWDLIDDNWTFIRGLFMDRFSAKYSASLGFCQFESWHVGDLLDLNRQMGAAIAVAHMAAEVGDSTTAARANLMLAGMSAARVRLAHAVRDLYDSGDLSSVVIRLGSDGRLNNSDIMSYYNNPNETIPYREYRDRTSDIRQVVWWDGADDLEFYSGMGHGHYAVMVGYSPLYPEVAELLHDQLLAETQEYVNTYVANDPWWWLGDLSHSKVGGGEHLYETPLLSFSIFQTKAYVLEESAAELRRQLPLSYSASGYRDLYRLQNLTAVLRAMPPASQTVSSATADQGDTLSYRVTVMGTGQEIAIESQIPAGVAYVNGSAQTEPDTGTLQVSGGAVRWSGLLDEEAPLDITWDVTVTTGEPALLAALTSVDNGVDSFTLRSVTIANGYQANLPFMFAG